MTQVYTVIGHHHDDPDRLLLLGADGRHYQYDVPQNKTTPVEAFSDDEWQVDPFPSETEAAADSNGGARHV